MCMHMSGSRCAGTGGTAPPPLRRTRPSRQARQLHIQPIVSAQQQHVSAVVLATDPARLAVAESLDSGPRGKDRSHPSLRLPDSLGSPEHSSVGPLAALVEAVATGLETPPADEPLRAVVERCNAALEWYLDCQRDAREREEPAAASGDELRRLVRLLRVVDRSDAPFLVRRIRRVLGRFDAHGEP